MDRGHQREHKHHHNNVDVGGDPLEEGEEHEGHGGDDPQDIDKALAPTDGRKAGAHDDDAAQSHCDGDEVDDGRDDFNFKDVGDLGLVVVVVDVAALVVAGVLLVRSPLDFRVHFFVVVVVTTLLVCFVMNCFAVFNFWVFGFLFVLMEKKMLRENFPKYKGKKYIRIYDFKRRRRNIKQKKQKSI